MFGTEDDSGSSHPSSPTPPWPRPSTSCFPSHGDSQKPPPSDWSTVSEEEEEEDELWLK